MTLIRLSLGDLAALQRGEVLDRIGGPSIRITLSKEARRQTEQVYSLLRELAALALSRKGRKDLDDPDIARFYAHLLHDDVVSFAQKLL